MNNVAIDIHLRNVRIVDCLDFSSNALQWQAILPATSDAFTYSDDSKAFTCIIMVNNTRRPLFAVLHTNDEETIL